MALWEVERFADDPERNGEGDWKVLGSGADVTAFYVDDGTGRVLVRPDEDVTFDVDADAEAVLEFGADEALPERIQTFLDRPDSDSIDRQPGLRSSDLRTTDGDEQPGDWKFHQDLVRPGEEAYVLGNATVRDDVHSADNATNAVFEPGDALSGMFLVADAEPEEFVEMRKNALWGFPVGALLVTAGFGVILWTVGVI